MPKALIHMVETKVRCMDQIFCRPVVPNLFLLRQPQTEQKKTCVPPCELWEGIIWHFHKKFKCKSKTDENLAYPLRYIKYPWGYAYSRLGTAPLDLFFLGRYIISRIFSFNLIEQKLWQSLTKPRLLLSRIFGRSYDQSRPGDNPIKQF